MSLTTKTRVLAFSAAVALMGAANVSAQDVSLNWNPRSGDVWVDQRLGDINQYAQRHREPFIDEMARYHAAPRDLVTDLIVRERWAPGDVYYACSIAQVIGRPCRYVVNEWNQDNRQGWGALAQRLGIKPGSAQFHRLKKGFVPTYDRWSRPIVLDADLRAAYPDRHHGNGKAKHHSDDHAGMSGHGDKKASSKGKSSAETKSRSSGNTKSAGKPAKGNGNDKSKGGKKD